mgnify:CR=1 FL=1
MGRAAVLAIAASWITFLGLIPSAASQSYFPPPDSEGGWRTLSDADEIRRVAGMEKQKLDEAFAYLQEQSTNGGLLVARRGWLVYERYFGRARRDVLVNTASIGKSFTSIAVGILMSERPDLFPQGLDQKVFTPRYFPPEMFPLSDPRKAEIRLGQLLAMTAGIRGNNPGIVRGKEVRLDPPGPDGWLAMIDAMAMGKMDGELNTKTLWCEPGEGYSYASSSIHLASVMLRHLAGMELREYVDEKLAKPLGWGRWDWGYKERVRDHTPGAGGIAPRATDLLRFAYLLLREGRWKDRRLVPAEYVRHCRMPSPYNPHFGYSLQFDVNGSGRWPDLPRDAFWKTGSGGFAIYIVPSLDLVVYKMGGRDSQYREFSPNQDAGSRDGSKRPAANTSADVYRKTLRMVVDAVVE